MVKWNFLVTQDKGWKIPIQMENKGKGERAQRAQSTCNNYMWCNPFLLGIYDT